MGPWGQNTLQVGVLNILLRASGAQLGLSVSRGVPTNPPQEVIIFGRILAGLVCDVTVQ